MQAAPTEPLRGMIPAVRTGPMRPADRRVAPELGGSAVRRARLTLPLTERRTALALIVAPAGYGKTSLLADWAAADARAFAWLRVDESLDRPAELWSAVCASLLTAGEPIASRLRDLDLSPDPVGVLADALAALSEDVVLVLDDYGAIDDPAVHESVMRFVGLAPRTLEVAIASRSEPPLAVTRLRVAGELVELRAADLAFDPSETREFLERGGVPDLDATDLASLQERTEGWPAGLSLACRALRTAKDRHLFVQRFGAGNRDVADYLVEQMLVGLEADDLRFVLRTSVLDTLTGDVADALIEDAGSARILERLERTNLLLDRLDDRREGYRYHPLLRDHLRIELARRRPLLVPQLHRRAAQWYARKGDPERAVTHAIAADDRELAAELISGAYLPLLQAGRLEVLAGWLGSIPSAWVRDDRRLAVARAWLLHFQGRHLEGDGALAVAMRAADTGPLPDGASSLESTIALIGAAFPDNDIGVMVRSARRAFELESQRDSPWRVTVHTQLGLALARSGRYDEARGLLRTAMELSPALGTWMDAVGCRAVLARVELESSDTAAAQRLARQAVALAQQHGLAGTATGAFARATLGSCLARTGETDKGEKELRLALPRLRQFGEPIVIAEALIALGRVQRHLGRHREATANLREAEALIAAMTDPGVLAHAVRTGRDMPVSSELSQRELEVLRVLADGMPKREAADRLFVSYNTLHSHVRSIYRKLDVRSRTEAVAWARRQGLLDRDGVVESPG